MLRRFADRSLSGIARTVAGVTWRPLLALLIAFVAIVAIGVTVRGDYGWPGTAMFTNPGYDYAPSVIADLDGDKTHFWWCGQGTSGYDVIKYRYYSNVTGTWSPIQTVLQPEQAWEAQHTCDPSVVGGNFSYGGNPYAFAMYYTATSGPGVQNKIGVAFSNDRVTWVKYSSNPIITPQVPGGSDYGVGQAATKNWDGGSFIKLFHTDTSTSYGTRMWFRTSSNGINFSAPVLVSNSLGGRLKTGH